MSWIFYYLLLIPTEAPEPEKMSLGTARIWIEETLPSAMCHDPNTFLLCIAGQLTAVYPLNLFHYSIFFGGGGGLPAVSLAVSNPCVQKKNMARCCKVLFGFATFIHLHPQNMSEPLLYWHNWFTITGLWYILVWHPGWWLREILGRYNCDSSNWATGDIFEGPKPAPQADKLVMRSSRGWHSHTQCSVNCFW